MKFEHSLKFNAVPEWQDSYLNYPALKKVIYKLQQEQAKLVAELPNDGGYDMELANSTTINNLYEDFKYGDLKPRTSKDGSDVAGSIELESSSSAAVIHPVNQSLSKFMNRFKSDKTEIVEVDVADEDEDVDYFAEFLKSLNSDDSFDPLKTFTTELIAEVSKISKFYNKTEQKVYVDYENLIKDLESNRVHVNSIFKFTQAYNNEDPDVVNTDAHHQYHIKSTLSRTTTNASVFDHINHVDQDLEKQEDDQFEDEDDDEDEEEVPNSVLLNHSDFDVKLQKKIALKKRSLLLFIELSELKSFIELNKNGFTKICKKFDKTCNYSTKTDFTQSFLPAHSHVFKHDTISELDLKIDEVVKIYAFLGNNLTSQTTQVDLDNIRFELKAHLRDHIVWERNTVWKELLSIEQKKYNLHSVAASDDGLLHLRLKSFKLPFAIGAWENLKIPASFFSWQIIKLAVTILVFGLLLGVKTFNDPVQGRCLAVLVAAAMLWALEALPLYVTSLFVPLLVVTCKVLKNADGTTMAGVAASQYILSTMWSSVIMVLVGGFTLAAALSKYNVAKVLSSYILSMAGTNPRSVLWWNMVIALFLGMWISNVAAPVLCYSLVQPVLRSLPTNSEFSKALVLGIALASNIAGMASPISSPQNVYAIAYMNPNPGWGKWFGVAIPVCIVALVLIWLELIFTFKFKGTKLRAYKPITDRFTVKQIYVCVVTVLTIILWCVMAQILSTFGEAGIISIIPIVLLFGTGLLKVDDLNNFPWGIVLLAMGGLALGKAVTSSGLLATIATALQHKIMNYDVYVIMIIFGILVLVVATFVSHTVATIIIVPLVKEVGESLPVPHPQLLIMVTALIASAAMGLPTSGFPNVTAISMTDELGKPYLTVNTFITRGVPASILAFACVITIGYGIMITFNF